MAGEESSCERALGLAAQALADGRLAAADARCRDILDRDPSYAPAHALLGAIAARAGLLEHGLRHLERALALDPDGASTKASFAAPWDWRDGGADARAEPRFLLIKAWGSGFWSDVSHVLGGLLLAEVTGRIPVVHWGTNCLYGDGSGRDAFTLYFAPVSGHRMEDLVERRPDADFFPRKWRGDNLGEENNRKGNSAYSATAPFSFLNRREPIAVCDFYAGVVDVMPWLPARHPQYGQSAAGVYRYLAGKYLRPLPSIAADAETFHREHLVGRRFISVHIRGSDKVHEMADLDAVNERYIALLDDRDPALDIFLLTDDEKWLDRIRTRYGARVIAAPCQRASDRRGIHNIAGGDRVGLGREVMRDFYLALRGEAFIGNGGSTVSGLIDLLGDWAPGKCVLVHPSRLRRGERPFYVDAQDREDQICVRESGPPMPEVGLIRHTEISETAFVHNWAVREPDGRWSDGRRPTIEWRGMPEAAGDLVCHIDAYAAVHELHPEQTVSAFVNGRPAARWTFRHAQALPALAIPLVREALRENKLVLSFEIDRPLVPIQLGISGDSRELGIFLRSFRFEPASRPEFAQAEPAPPYASG